MSDYTKYDTPFGGEGEIDDFEIADNSAPKVTAEDITKANSYADVPPGEHILEVQGFASAPKFDYYKVDVNGVTHSYEAAAVRVRFCLPGQPKTTIEDYFVLPPADPSQMVGYLEGIPPGKKAKGFNASKFYQFIGSLGWPYPPGGKLSAEARRIGNWRGRQVHAVAEPGRPYEEKKDGIPTGVMKPGRPQIKLFSYKPVGSVAAAQQPVTANYNRPAERQTIAAGSAAGAGARAASIPVDDDLNDL